MSGETPDQAPEKTKAELFAENPDRFEDTNDILLCIKKVEGKYMFMLDPRMSDIDAYVIRGMAWDRIVEFQTIRGMEKMKNGSRIVTPGEAGKQGFRGFLKNGR